MRPGAGGWADTCQGEERMRTFQVGQRQRWEGTQGW